MKLLNELSGDVIKNFGDNYENLTQAQLKMFLALSGPVNSKAYPKGGKGIDSSKLPETATREKGEDGKKGKIVAAGGGPPSMPFSRTCKKGDKLCIAKQANAIVQDYFSKIGRGAKRPGALPEKSTKNNAKRKRAQKKVFDPVTQIWAAPRPAGTATTTGLKQRWKDYVEEPPPQETPVAMQPIPEVPVPEPSALSIRRKVPTGSLRLSPEAMKNVSKAAAGVPTKTTTRQNSRVPKPD